MSVVAISKGPDILHVRAVAKSSPTTTNSYVPGCKYSRVKFSRVLFFQIVVYLMKTHWKPTVSALVIVERMVAAFFLPLLRLLLAQLLPRLATNDAFEPLGAAFPSLFRRSCNKSCLLSQIGERSTFPEITYFFSAVSVYRWENFRKGQIWIARQNYFCK